MHRQPLKAVCFDLFHTLVDVGQQVPGRYTADILGVSREDWNTACFSDLHDICSPTDHLQVVRILAHSLDPDIPLERIEMACAERQERFDHALRHVEEEVLAVIRALRQRGLRIALVSNASTGEVRAWDESPLAALMDVTVFSCECGHAKPARAIYHHALAGLGVAPHESLFVGDGGSREHEGAREVGLHTVLVTRHVRDRLSDEVLAARRLAARYEIHGLRELLDLLPA